jgi:hypothetical protein
MRARLVVAALAAAIAVVLVADGLALVAVRSRHDRLPPALAAALPELEAFVERARGLRFDQRVPIELLSPAEFESRLRGPRTAQQSQILASQSAFAGLLRALGLVKGPVDLDAASRSQADGVVGFYESRTRRLYVRGKEVTPFLKEVLVHELTHALDDQRFGLNRGALAGLQDESAPSFRALAEGDAVVVEQRYLASLPAGERRTADAAGRAVTGPEPTVPEVLVRLASYPYQAGARFVEQLVAAGGQGRLNQAFESPPTTSEQILHPDRFLSGDSAGTVTRPEPNGRVVDRGVLGEMGLRLVLGSAVDGATALRQATGWAADRYVTWADGPRTCLRWHIAMDSPADTTDVAAGLRTWATKNPGAKVEGTNPVVVTNCA